MKHGKPRAVAGGVNACWLRCCLFLVKLECDSSLFFQIVSDKNNFQVQTILNILFLHFNIFDINTVLIRGYLPEYAY